MLATSLTIFTRSPSLIVTNLHRIATLIAILETGLLTQATEGRPQL